MPRAELTSPSSLLDRSFRVSAAVRRLELGKHPALVGAPALPEVVPLAVEIRFFGTARVLAFTFLRLAAGEYRTWQFAPTATVQGVANDPHTLPEAVLSMIRQLPLRPLPDPRLADARYVLRAFNTRDRDRTVLASEIGAENAAARAAGVLFSENTVIARLKPGRALEVVPWGLVREAPAFIATRLLPAGPAAAPDPRVREASRLTDADRTAIRAYCAASSFAGLNRDGFAGLPALELADADDPRPRARVVELEQAAAGAGYADFAAACNSSAHVFAGEIPAFGPRDSLADLVTAMGAELAGRLAAVREQLAEPGQLKTEDAQHTEGTRAKFQFRDSITVGQLFVDYLADAPQTLHISTRAEPRGVSTAESSLEFLTTPASPEQVRDWLTAALDAAAADLERLFAAIVSACARPAPLVSTNVYDAAVAGL